MHKTTFGLTTALFLLFCSSCFAEIPEAVTLQLKWFHQFQFAGYYAAIEQGYYAEEGLELTIRERDPSQDYIEQVSSGQANYGIADSGIIAQYANGSPIVALAAVFQHDALVLFSKPASGIISPYEMAGKRIMYDVQGENNAPVRALLAEAKLNESRYQKVAETFNSDAFIADEVDVMSGYLTDRPLLLRAAGVPFNIINPQNYGIDFYGDLLFTSRQELAQHPGRAERFRRASLKGWEYALAHPEDIIQLILTKYQSKLSLAQLRFEAEETRKLILPDTIPLGQLDTARLRRVADTYANLKLARPLSDDQLKDFVFPVEQLQAFQLSEEETLWLAQHPEIKVGIAPDFRAYEWLEQSGEFQTILAEYLKLIERRLGIKFLLVKEQSWQKRLGMLQRGELDMLAGSIESSDSETYLDFTRAFMPVSLATSTAQSGEKNENQIAVSKSNPVLLSLLDKALASISHAEHDFIAKHWLGLKVERGIRLEALLRSAVVVLLIFLFFAYWVFRLREEIKSRKRSEADLARLYTNMSLGFALHQVIRDDSGKIVDYGFLDINPAFEKMTGIARENWIGKTVKQVMPDTESGLD